MAPWHVSWPRRQMARVPGGPVKEGDHGKCAALLLCVSATGRLQIATNTMTLRACLMKCSTEDANMCYTARHTSQDRREFLREEGKLGAQASRSGRGCCG